MRLYLIRHPQTSVPPGVCYGSTDVPLAASMLDAAVIALAGLPKKLPIVSSPLTRCARLAERLRRSLDSPAVEFDLRLAEMDFGAWEMRAWNEIARAEVDAWAADIAFYRPGGGENVVEMARRVRAAHAEFVANGADRIVVCHAGTIRLLLACGRGLPAEQMAIRAGRGAHGIAYGGLIVLEC